MKKVALSTVKDGLSRFLRLAEKEEVVITRHGKAAGVLIGFENEDDWLDYRLQEDSRFLAGVASSLRTSRARFGSASPLHYNAPDPITEGTQR